MNVGRRLIDCVRIARRVGQARFRLSVYPQQSTEMGQQDALLGLPTSHVFSLIKTFSFRAIITFDYVPAYHLHTTDFIEGG